MSSGDLSFRRRWSGDTEVLPTGFKWNGRPLVVIDPEDREQVKHLLAEFCRAVDASDIPAHPQGWSTNAMQAALREFANPKPPKPDEPTGLGAVVEDEDGGRWVRREATHYPWGNGGIWGTWDDLTVVRILSEGVQP